MNTVYLQQKKSYTFLSIHLDDCSKPEKNEKKVTSYFCKHLSELITCVNQWLSLECSTLLQKFEKLNFFLESRSNEKLRGILLLISCMSYNTKF